MIRLLKNLLRPTKQKIYSLLNIGEPPPHNPVIPPIGTEDLFQNSVPSYSLFNLSDTYGEPTLNELITIAKVISYFKPKLVFEIGTFEGGTTSHIAVNTPKQSKIYTLDLGEENIKEVWDKTLDVYPYKTGVRFIDSYFEDKITQLLGDSQTFDFSDYHGIIDLVFVDACHHYDHVKKDSENAFKMIRPGGVILWHDYASYAPGVMKVLDEISAERKLLQIKDTSLVIFKNDH